MTEAYTPIGIVGNAEIVCFVCFRHEHGQQTLYRILENQEILDRECNRFSVLLSIDARASGEYYCHSCHKVLEERL